MSSGDFAAELRQSVADHLALIQTAARAAKARIGEAIPEAPPGFAPVPAFDAPEPPPPRAAVNFFADEPVFNDPVFNEAPVVEDESFASALTGPPESLPEGAIAFDDGFAVDGVDDEGIPVWEDAP
ncbi:MAG: hypothetical protein JO322_03975 [Candidatus Eremiobacteraeota bacterium]|nr:hypothetical protein [Candidatus Eremiobacteraeota bacterium]